MAWLASVIIGVAGGYYYYWIQLYPQYLGFMDKFHFDAQGWERGKGNWYYYSLELTSFITSLQIPRSIDVEHAGYVEVCAYWRIFTLEENFMAQWNLEIFDKRWLENQSVVWTLSHTATENITKRWQFWQDKPTFTVEIWRGYMLSGDNMNNQIIIDANNKAIHPIENGIIYELGIYDSVPGVFGYRILEAKPNNVTIQIGHPTETQINFYGQSDRDLRFHTVGETEYIKILAYANQFGSVNDVLW